MGLCELNAPGTIASEFWSAIPVHFPNVELDAFVIMPDHMHGIIILHDIPHHRRGAVTAPGIARKRVIDRAPALAKRGVPAPESPENGSSGAGLPRPYESKQPFSDSTKHAPTLGQIVAFFKYQSTKRINQIHGIPSAPVWQRNYYEHIIRDRTNYRASANTFTTIPFGGKWIINRSIHSLRRGIITRIHVYRLD